MGNHLRLAFVLLMCCAFNNLNAQQKSITGTVNDDTGVPLPGVNIVIDGTTRGTLTDFDGNFSIDASSDETLVFSYLGMKSKSIVLQGETQFNIVLEADSEALEEVVVVGYGTQKKSDIVSSVVSIDEEKMLKVATSDIGEMLRGQAAGVQITLGDGGPGSSSEILIRGKNSIQGKNGPLIIADGVPIANINDINANDVASMEILKDAAAQAIYGARASNGVVLITTKRGKEGKMAVSYNGFTGIQTINRNFDIYSGEEYTQLKREAARTSNLGVYLPDDQLFSGLELASIQSGEFIDWEKEVLGMGTTQNHNLSISSGTDKMNVYTSLNYFKQSGVIQNSDYNRVTARLNVDQKLNKWLKIGLNSSFQYSNDNRPNVGNVILSTTEDTAPNVGGVILSSITTSSLGQIYNEDGSLRLEPSGFEENKNPLVNLNETNTEDKNTNNLLNIFLDVTPFKGFKYRLNASRRSWNQKTLSYNTSESVSGIASGGLGNGNISFNDLVEKQLENIFTFDTDFNSESKHNLNLTAVQSISETESNSFINRATDIPNDILGIRGLQSARTNLPEVSGNIRGLLSFVGRVQYDFNSKYYLTLSGRSDASTVFGANNKWAFFPAAAIGWNMHKETFIEKGDAINNLKLRLSYGSVGSQAIDPYQSIALADLREYIIDGIKVSGFVGGNEISNPDLKWETSTTFNAAIDLGLWQNRITTTIEYYNTSTKDLLFRRLLNASTGYSNQLVNLGEVQNKGVEVSLNTAIIRKKDFKLNLGLIFSKNENKIITLTGLDADADGIEDDDVLNELFIGKPIDVAHRYEAIGIFQEGEDIISSAQPLAKPGDIKLLDKDNNGLIDADDRVVTDLTPDWFGALNLGMEYKGIDFSANITTVQGVTKDNSFLYGYTEGGSLRGIKNGIKQNYWTPENPGGDFPRPNDSDDPTNLITKGLQDASYVRLQNVTLGYSLPTENLSTIGLNKLRVYVTGSNLITSTDYQSYSPEKLPSEYPEAVSIVMGLQVSF